MTNEAISIKTRKPVRTNKVAETAKASRYAQDITRKALKIALTRMSYVARAKMAVVIVLLTLSLTHISEGVVLVTHVPAWQGLALAIGIELGYVLSELGEVVSHVSEAHKAYARSATPVKWATIGTSAIMNVLAFTASADGLLHQVIGGAFGAGLPFLVLFLSKGAITLQTAKR